MTREDALKNYEEASHWSTAKDGTKTRSAQKKGF